MNKWKTKFGRWKFDKKILLLRYFRGKTQSEVAQMLNVSQVQVSRIEAKIIDALRKRMT